MTSSKVIDFYNQCENLGIQTWIDGGFCVDALLGRQLRPHKDLDIAVQWKDVPKLREVLSEQGYKQIKEDSRWNFVLADDKGCEIDVHAFIYDDKGNVIDGIMYPAESLTGTGTINGQSIKCISPKYMVEFLAPWLHKWPEKYLDAITALCEKFKIDLPKEYVEFTKPKYIIWLTGASGVGKTTLLSTLKEKYSDQDFWEFLKFDSIGVPSNEEMVRDYGSGENWQRVKTYEWIERMVNNFPDKKMIVMDGQANLEFIKTGFEKQNFKNYQIILIDCDQAIMVKRLVDERQQAWLASDDMKNWLKFLRKQAQDMKVPIIDTSRLTPQQVVTEFEKFYK